MRREGGKQKWDIASVNGCAGIRWVSDVYFPMLEQFSMFHDM